jgi:hypothetical protein
MYRGNKLLIDYQHNDIELLRYRWSDSLFIGWLQFAIGIIALGVFVNIDFHFIIGAIITIIGIVVIICAVSVSICIEFYKNNTKKLLQLDSIFLWIIRILCLVTLVPLFIWTATKMFQDS